MLMKRGVLSLSLLLMACVAAFVYFHVKSGA